MSARLPDHAPMPIAALIAHGVVDRHAALICPHCNGWGSVPEWIRQRGEPQRCFVCSGTGVHNPAVTNFRYDRRQVSA
jgi:hypothetical protein